MLGQPEGRKWPPWGASPITVVTGRLPSHTNCWSDSVKRFLHSHFLMTFLNVKMQFFIWDFFDLWLPPPHHLFWFPTRFSKIALRMSLNSSAGVSRTPSPLWTPPQHSHTLRLEALLSDRLLPGHPVCLGVQSCDWLGWSLPLCGRLPAPQRDALPGLWSCSWANTFYNPFFLV